MLEVKEMTVVGPYFVRRSGNIGVEILDAEGTVVVWTVDLGLGALIAQLLTENDEISRSAGRHSKE